MLDDVARFNRDRWEDLARARVRSPQPWVDLDAASARVRVDPEGMLGDVAGFDVLCLPVVAGSNRRPSPSLARA